MMENRSLYEITADFQRLYDMAQEEEFDQDCFDDCMESLDYEFEQKADGYVKVSKNLLADAEKLKAQAKCFKDEYDRLMTRVKSLENSSKRILSNLGTMMEVADKKKFKTDLFSFSVRKTQSVDLKDGVDINSVPSDYLRFKAPEIDKSLVKKAIKNGEKLDFITITENVTAGIR